MNVMQWISANKPALIVMGSLFVAGISGTVAAINYFTTKAEFDNFRTYLSKELCRDRLMQMEIRAELLTSEIARTENDIETINRILNGDLTVSERNDFISSKIQMSARLTNLVQKRQTTNKLLMQESCDG
ncbi:MAG: hypothetical protein WC284_09530 [Candidimonas sp.]